MQVFVLNFFQTSMLEALRRVKRVVKSVVASPRERVYLSIRHHRKNEQLSGEDFYRMDRGLQEYEDRLGKFDKVLDYVNRLGRVIVLDVGAGTTKAIKELEDLCHIKGLTNLSFMATVLTYGSKVREKIKGNLGLSRTLVTSAEVLRGVKAGSVGLLLSVWSITYSADLKMVAESFHRVLAPGGVLKVFFPKVDLRRKVENLVENGVYISEGDKFVEYLKALRYDVAVSETQTNFGMVILAIKRGGVAKLSANQLLVADLGDALHQE